MKKLLIILVFFGFTFADYAYSLADNNTTSPTYGMDVWNPEYSGFITMHFFSSQGWAGWTATFGQLSNFQDELRNDDGYENVVIIAVGQSNTSGFNASFCSNSNLPLVIDQYPSLPIREQFGESSFNEFHKRLFIIGHDGEYLGDILLNSLTNSSKNIIRNIIAENYQQSIEGCTDDTATNYDADATVDDGSCDYPILGDINDDAVVNVQDIIILVNMILAGETDSAADLNSDGVVNILDVVQVVNIILS